MFSTRLPASLAPNRLTVALEAARASGRPIIDLTLSNPTRAGFDYPAGLLAPLADARGLVYSPHPIGSVEARAAVAADYRRRGLPVAPEHLVLTSSTSEAYSMLLKLLCNPGDQVLIPRPSYPLLDHLAALEAVSPVPYDLDYHGRWSVDMSGVERSMSAKTRALLIVSPNNPTGSFVASGEIDELARLCARSGIALIVDEVFGEYELVPGAQGASGQALMVTNALTFSLGGLSKTVGLPQVKLAWMALAGPPSLVDAALARLEIVCDTYLSISTPVQLAAGELLSRGAAVRRQIQARIAANFRRLAVETERTPACQRLHAEGGWYGVLRVPSLGPEEDLVLQLLEAGVLVHPGYFFDFSRESFLVVSLLPPEADFAEGVSRVLRHFASSAVTS